ncbi:MAG: TolC family protein [Chlamydiia bacterium]|nr:TolC family protein [Chlamydiia bacterium]
MYKPILYKILFVLCAGLLVAGCVRVDREWCSGRAAKSRCDWSQIYSSLPCIDHPLTLCEVIDIAVKNNLDLRVKQQEAALERETVTHATWKMLPKLEAEGHYSYRDKNTGTSSESLDPTRPPAPPSISSEQTERRASLVFTWNLLDFGLSYFERMITARKALIKAIEYERAKQNLVLDVQKQYWRVITSRRIMEHATEVRGMAMEWINSAKRAVDAKLIPQYRTLTDAAEVAKLNFDLESWRKDYVAAMHELLMAMGLPPETTLCLAPVELGVIDISHFNVCELERVALLNRPELFAFDTQEEIVTDEVRAALIQMVPGVELFAGTFTDANRYLVYNNWNQVGIKALWDLFNLPEHYHTAKCMAFQKRELIRKNRLAICMGIFTQLHLAYGLYQENLMEYRDAIHSNEIHLASLSAATSERNAGFLPQREWVMRATEQVISEAAMLRTYSELRGRLAQLDNSMGLPTYFSAQEHLSCCQ